MNIRFPIALVCVAVLAACTHTAKDPRSSTNFNADSIVQDKTLTPAQKGEKLALGAEQLMTPASFMYADAVADMALTFDSSNLRAQMVKVLVKPAVLNKGIYKRVAPLANLTEKGKADYKQTLDQVNKWPNIALKKFILDGKEDIKTEAQAQAFIAQITKAYDGIRVFFKNHKDMELTVHIPGDLWQKQMVDQRASQCEASQWENSYTVVCDYSDIGEYKIGRAENEIMQQYAAGAMIYQTFMNAYNVDGVDAYITAVQNIDPATITTKQTLTQLLQTKTFGTLRDTQGLNGILSLGLDLVSGARWAASIQKSLCPTGAENESNRPGYLLNVGICISQDPVDEQGDKFEDVVRTAEFALRGGVLNATVTSDDGARSMATALRPSVLLSSPVRDVRALGPFTYSADGSKISSIGDKTLGGVFVNGDFNRVSAFDGDLTIHASK